MAFVIFAAGVGTAIVGRVVMLQLLRVKFRYDLARLNEGDLAPLLRGYAPDAVLRFHEGQHRWSGIHRGRDAIQQFLTQFVRAGLRGEIRELWIGGPPWALSLVARFDDRAEHDGAALYANRAILVVRTRWGRIVEQEDFFEDTQRIAELEQKLNDLHIPA